MNELYKKINHYVYEIRMIEIDEYLYGMNRKKIDKEKAYDIITNSESNAIINFWKGRDTDRKWFDCYKQIPYKENQLRANVFYRKALELNIEGMAEAGDKYAQACLGYMYQFGRSVDQNYSTAVEWYREAAEQGYAIAQDHLGHMYYWGDGVNKNLSTAVEWYRKAAEQGHVYAQSRLGHMYEDGYGVDQNYSTAMEWYRKAGDQGHTYAYRSVGEMYQYGYGVEKRISTALEWYRKSAERGDAIAQRNIDHLTQKPRKKKRLRRTTILDYFKRLN